MALDAVPRPWQALPAFLGAVLREEIPSIADEVVGVMTAEIPEYWTLEGAFGRDLRRHVEDALAHFAGVIEHRPPTLDGGRELYVALGREEWRAGRSLDALQAAYRLGARVVWRRIGASAAAAGADPATMGALAESVFAYLEEIAAVTVEAFARAQAAAAGELERRRHRLVAVLVAPVPAGGSALLRAARDAAWAIPRLLAAAALGDHVSPPLERRLPADVLVGVVDGTGCLVIPDPEGPGRRQQLERALAGHAVALGPTVAPEDAGRSWARARGLHHLQATGAVPADGPARADEYLLALLLQEDPSLVEDLARHRLAALDGLPPRSRERLETTLLAYLRHRGNGPRVAAELGVHLQTVRYRLGRLRELLGDALEDPDARFELEVVLRAQRSQPAAASAAPSSS